MDREELKRYLPHREPMLLVDSSEVVAEGKVVSTYTIPEDAYFVQGHFPGNPIVPGVILCEIMAQGSVLLFKDKLAGRLGLYAGLNKVRFKRQVHPGETVEVRSSMSSSHEPLISVEAKAYVNDELCCSGMLSFMLTEYK
ncbi:MAG: beta-hydroxyacyl-ACP dehydratase [Bacteroidales bacterium]|nr:beta-hydroxyacyl-ACP dehydratase [Bacteroidales bacterium]